MLQMMSCGQSFKKQYMIGSYQERLHQAMYLGAVMLAKACWIFDDGSKIQDDHLSLDY